VENVERKVLELFRELEGVYPKEHWFWIYTCLKRWYYYWYHLRSEHFAKMNLTIAFTQKGTVRINVQQK